MRKLYTATLLCFIALATAQCPTGDVTLTNQAQVNAFLTNYPNCNAVPGKLFISGADITNLQPLSQLISVGGNLSIYMNPQLQNLNGLNAITNVGGTFEVIVNSQLSSIAAMQNLATTGNSLIVSNNQSLTSLNGLQGLTTVGGLLSIKNMPIASLDGLNNLNSIGFFMEISNNANLTSLSALMNLHNVSGYLDLQYNPLLTTLSGLDNINPNNITSIVIRYSPNLSFCSVPSFCNYLGPIGSGTFDNNATGCNSVTQIQNICANLAVEKIQSEVFAIYPNPVSETLNFKFKNQDKIEALQITDVSGKTVLQKQNVPNTINISKFNPGVYFISAQIGTTVYKAKFLKK